MLYKIVMNVEKSFSREFPIGIKTAQNETVCAIGDIHGNFHLMYDMVTKLGKDYFNSRLIFLGDLISRGPDSASCLLLAWHMAFENPHPFKKVEIILGNHEHGFFLPLVSDKYNFLAPFWASKENSNHWMSSIWSVENKDKTYREIFISVLQKSEYGLFLGPEKCVELLDKWIEYAFVPFMHGIPKFINSPIFKKSGNVIFVHAGLNVTKSDLLKKFQRYNILNHTTKDFKSSPIWMKKVFFDGLKTHIPTHKGKQMFIVHGHVIEKKRLKNGWIDMKPVGHRIGLDSGAYDTGILTAGIFSTGKVVILEIKK